MIAIYTSVAQKFLLSQILRSVNDELHITQIKERLKSIGCTSKNAPEVKKRVTVKLNDATIIEEDVTFERLYNKDE